MTYASLDFESRCRFMGKLERPFNHIYANVLVRSPYLRLTCANPDFWDLGCWNAEEQPGGVRKGPCSATIQQKER